MDALTFLLTGPGQFWARLFFVAAADPDSEAQADLAVTLGLATWVVALLVLWVLVRRGWRLRLHAPQRWLGSLRRVAGGWTPQRVAGALWRAQAAHLALYLALPLAWEVPRWVYFGATAPLWVIGPGQGPNATDGTLAHLRSPACWTFVTPCSGPHSNFLQGPREPRAQQPTKGVPGLLGPLATTEGWFVKGLWALATLAWLAHWRRRWASLPGDKAAPRAAALR